MGFLPVRRILAAGLSILSSAAYSQTAILGILEEHPGTYYGDSSYRGIRVVFQKDGSEWKAFKSECPDHDCGDVVAPAYPGQITWTITFDGRAIGNLTSGAPERHTGAFRGVQTIVSGGPVPTVGKRTEEFMDASVYRPLVANSQPYFKDPDGWKPFVPSQHLIVELRSEFRKRFPELCRTSKTDESKLEPLRYADKEVKLVRAYSSKTGRVLARLHLQAIDCNDTEAGFDIDDPWFTASAKGSISYLGSGLRLVDAGDYDNDGKSELVFAINRENRGGYELFYDDFEKHAVFEFGYQ